jgi:hypothetical protein
MTELRRIRMKMGDAAFEADVPEDRVQPMYDKFIAVLECRSQIPRRMYCQNGHAPNTKTFVPYADATRSDPEESVSAAEMVSAEDVRDRSGLMRIFDVHLDGLVILKILPQGDGKEAEALLLILYGYRRLKNEEDVLATRLLRAAKHSGVIVNRAAPKLATHDRFVVRGGHRKATTYSLTLLGLAMAQEITTKMVA